jgi:hypothetical protein
MPRLEQVRKERINELVKLAKKVPEDKLHDFVINYCFRNWMVNKATAEDYYEVVRSIIEQQ